MTIMLAAVLALPGRPNRQRSHSPPHHDPKQTRNGKDETTFGESIHAGREQAVPHRDCGLRSHERILESTRTALRSTHKPWTASQPPALDAGPPESSYMRKTALTER
jgi:hypothetical protein